MRSLAVAVAILACASSGHAQIPAARVSSAELWFDAKATLGDFRGISKAARGEIAAAGTLRGVRGFVEMQAMSLSTDNGLRDRDMRKTLEVEKYPTIRYDLDSVDVRLETGDSAAVELVGRMTIHGVTRPLRIPAALSRQNGVLRIRGGCDVYLPAYGVTKLKRMLGMLSMNETIRMGFDVTFTTQPPEEQLTS
jgi:polyisoprenoid-binding protein YceI